MSRQIEQALLSMMPTLGSDLPSSLIELSSSLLSQSRNVASALKAEEETARLYACANIACDRLKISLDLPPIEPRPPVPPRVYKKLYAHLDNNLLNQSTPSKRAGGRTQTPTSKSRGNSGIEVFNETPTRKHCPAKSQSSGKATPSLKKIRNRLHSDGDGLLPWIRPVIRFLCAELGHKNLGPTVIAGVECITAPGGRRSEDEWVTQNVSALVAAVYYLTVLRATNVGAEDIEKSQYVAQRKDIISMLKHASDKVTLKDMDHEVVWQDWRVLKTKDFDVAVEQMNVRGWLAADWYRSISDISGSSGPLKLLEEDGEEMATQTRRADTMFQERYDFLSEARRNDYKAWKERILLRIDEMAPNADKMEIDT